MNYYTAYQDNDISKRVVFEWPRGQSPHQSQRHTSIRGPWASKELAEESLQNTVDDSTS